MKRYISLRWKIFDDYSAYCSGKSHGDLEHFAILNLFIRHSNPDYYLEVIREGRFGSATDYTGADWSKTTNSVIIYITTEISDDNEEFFVMRFGNFKKMIEDWVALKRKRVPEIYFIINDQRQVFVSDKLEEV